MSSTDAQHPTTRDINPLTSTRAQAVIAAAILRRLHAVVTTTYRSQSYGRYR